MIMYHDQDFHVDQMQTTMRHMLLDEQSRKGSKRGIAGKVFAMATSTQVTCFECGESGHIRRNCPRKKSKERTQKAKPEGARKWCSVHFTTKHSDEECYQYRAKRPDKSNGTGKAFSACAHCTHCSSARDKKESAAAKRASSTKAVIDYSADGDDSDEGFMYTTIHTGTNAKATSAGTTLPEDTGATETMLDNRFIPGLKAIMQEYRDLAKPEAIMVGGNHDLKGTTTGLVHCTVKDSCGKQQTVHLRGLIVPGLGRHVFSPTSKIKRGSGLSSRAASHTWRQVTTSYRWSKTRATQACARWTSNFKPSPGKRENPRQQHFAPARSTGHSASQTSHREPIAQMSHSPPRSTRTPGTGDLDISTSGAWTCCARRRATE